MRFQQRLTLTAFLEARRGVDKQDPEGHDGEVDNEEGSQGKFLIDLGSLIRIEALFLLDYSLKDVFFLCECFRFVSFLSQKLGNPFVVFFDSEALWFDKIQVF